MKTLIALALLIAGTSAQALGSAGVTAPGAKAMAQPAAPATMLTMIDERPTSVGPVGHDGEPVPAPAFQLTNAADMEGASERGVARKARLQAAELAVTGHNGAAIVTGGIWQVSNGPSPMVAFLAAAAGVLGLGLIAVFWVRGRDEPAPTAHGRIAVDTRDFIRAVAEPSLVRLDIQHADSDYPQMRDVGLSSSSRATWDEEPLERVNYNVAEYRLYRLNITGIVDTAESGLFADDGAALAHARVFGDGMTVEVWQGSREVAVLPARAAEGTERSADYRFHRLDDSGSVRTTFRQRLQNDAEAMLHAITLSQGDSIDVWSPLRRLGTVRSGPIRYAAN